jgi:hypothetical protein
MSGDEIDRRLTTLLDGREAEGELDVGYDGLEHDYSARIPEIESLMNHGTAHEREIACWMLASWGVPSGLRQLLRWVENPETVPGGEDLALLAEALTNMGSARERTEEADRLRLDVVRAALARYDEIEVGSAIATTLLAERELIDAVAPDVESAIERALQASPPPSNPPLRRQAVSLIAVLLVIDEARAALLARQIREARPVDDELLVELASSLEEGLGADTRAILEDIAASPWKRAAARAKEALARR